MDLGTGGRQDRVTGPALDFCLLVTQRRHRDDLALGIEGAGRDRVDDDRAGLRWYGGTGRSPDQFGRGPHDQTGTHRELLRVLR